jgi:hypothetical protein
MPTLVALKPKPRQKSGKKSPARVKRAFKFELTTEDIALDDAISAAAARSLAKRRT